MCKSQQGICRTCWYNSVRWFDVIICIDGSASNCFNLMDVSTGRGLSSRVDWKYPRYVETLTLSNRVGGAANETLPLLYPVYHLFCLRQYRAWRMSTAIIQIIMNGGLDGWQKKSKPSALHDIVGGLLQIVKDGLQQTAPACNLLNKHCLVLGGNRTIMHDVLEMTLDTHVNSNSAANVGMDGQDDLWHATHVGCMLTMLDP